MKDKPSVSSSQRQLSMLLPINGAKQSREQSMLRSIEVERLRAEIFQQLEKAGLRAD